MLTGPPLVGKPDSAPAALYRTHATMKRSPQRAQGIAADASPANGDRFGGRGEQLDVVTTSAGQREYEQAGDGDGETGDGQRHESASSSVAQHEEPDC